MLKFDVISLLCTAGNLLLLYFLMKKFLFDKVNAIFEQRQQMIDEDYAAAEAAKTQAEADRADYVQKMEAAREEMGRVIQEMMG